MLNNNLDKLISLGVGFGVTRTITLTTTAFDNNIIAYNIADWNDFVFSGDMFTCPVSGKYIFTLSLSMTAVTSAYFAIGLIHNSQVIPISSDISSGSGGDYVNCTIELLLSAGDTVKSFVFTNTSMSVTSVRFTGSMSKGD